MSEGKGAEIALGTGTAAAGVLALPNTGSWVKVAMSAIIVGCVVVVAASFVLSRIAKRSLR